MSSDQSPSDSTSFKVAFIGAGSIGFTRKLVGDILTVPEFAGIDLAFMDISEQNLSMVERLVRRDLEANGLDGVRLTGTLDQREAVSGARYVFCTARIGGLPAFATDIEVPLGYGIDQCVGDTLCAGGIMYGQRGIPVILALCRDIREAAEPGCRFFNYSNPMAMLTWAANRYGGIPHRPACATACRAATPRSPTRWASPPRSSTTARPASTTRPGTSSSCIAAATCRASCWRRTSATRSTARRKRCGSRCCAASAATPPSPTATSANTCPGSASARTRSATGST